MASVLAVVSSVVAVNAALIFEAPFLTPVTPVDDLKRLLRMVRTLQATFVADKLLEIKKIMVTRSPNKRAQIFAY